MSFDEILTYVLMWTEVGGRFIQLTMTSIGDIVGDDSLWSVVLPNVIKNATIAGLMFGGGFTLFLGITIWKWAKETIL